MARMDASKLKEIRLRRLLSMAEVARKAGVNPRTITWLEEGKPARAQTYKRVIEGGLGMTVREAAEIGLLIHESD
jgi:transcriptional regulator with XRE-family HTH domain